MTEVVQIPRLVILEKQKGFLIKDVYKTSVIKISTPGLQGPQGIKGDKGDAAQIEEITVDQINNLFG